ncbi:hypothetical protein KDK_28930 [Dictyobacter kobayashii]|uniref:Copper resistance protein D domain-containing protein n=2 Tax=Dictyobacter kobayashii TaxID=2014872 RepID=A0A402AJ49_9CHLR|nr:hypothetical protein KDK_28930 [Dictyobacter kobayashii]
MLLRSSTFFFWSLLAIGIGSLALLLYQSSIASEAAPWAIFTNQALTNVLFKSRFGVIWLFRIFLLLIASLIWFVSRRIIADRQDPLNELWGFLLLIGIAIMFTTSLDSHAASRQDLWFMIPADVLHMLGAGFLVGG